MHSGSWGRRPELKGKYSLIWMEMIFVIDVMNRY